MAGLLSVLPSSRVGNVTRLIVFCASLLDPGHGSWILLLNHWAEQISETKSYARVFVSAALNGTVMVGSTVNVLIGSLVGVAVCNDTGSSVGV